MKEEKLGIDVPLPKDKSWRFPMTLLAAFLVVGVLLWAGGEIRPVKPELPANQQCIASNQATKDAVKVFSVQLVAALDGVDAPAPDLSKVKAASLECKATADQVTVKVEAQK